MRCKYFVNCRCIEDVKEQYHKLTKMYHPDLNRDMDTTEIMKAINAEFTELHKQYKNIHRSTKEAGATYESTQATQETPEEFIEILNKIIHLDGIEIEICGKWIWISGDTRKYKDILKQAGCRWASKKLMWYWHAKGEECKHRGNVPIEKIRERYGSTTINTEKLYALA